MKNIGTYKLTQNEVGFYKEDHPDLLTDGRHIGRVGETWAAKFVNGVRQAENSPFDILTNKSEYYEKNTRIEVRSAIKKVSFAPSKEVGYGRTVTEDGFIGKLENLDVFIIIDSRQIGQGYVNLIELTKNDILKLELGKNKNMSAKKFWNKIDTWK